jgi:hypothetical protein
VGGGAVGQCGGDAAAHDIVGEMGDLSCFMQGLKRRFSGVLNPMLRNKEFWITNSFIRNRNEQTKSF